MIEPGFYAQPADQPQRHPAATTPSRDPSHPSAATRPGRDPSTRAPLPVPPECRYPSRPRPVHPSTATRRSFGTCSPHDHFGGIGAVIGWASPFRRPAPGQKGPLIDLRDHGANKRSTTEPLEGTASATSPASGLRSPEDVHGANIAAATGERPRPRENASATGRASRRRAVGVGHGRTPRGEHPGESVPATGRGYRPRAGAICLDPRVRILRRVRRRRTSGTRSARRHRGPPAPPR